MAKLKRIMVYASLWLPRTRAWVLGRLVSTFVSEHLESFPQKEASLEGVRAFLELAAQSVASGGWSERSWTRHDIHERCFSSQRRGGAN